MSPFFAVSVSWVSDNLREFKKGLFVGGFAAFRMEGRRGSGSIGLGSRILETLNLPKLRVKFF
jgi:hypothetical protein